MKRIKLYMILFWILISPNIFSQKKFTIIDTTSTIQLKEVTIQAEKTDYKLQKVPASASVVTSVAMKEHRIESLTDLTLRIPNFYMPEYGTRLTSPVYIRGIGSRINSPSVGLYVDNIPYLDKGAFDFYLVGIRKIEVLRGPQGTLYGRNTMGGLIKIYTADPEFYREGGASIDYGNNNNIRGSVFYNTPLGKSMSIRGDAAILHENGYIKNIYDNRSVDRMNTYAGRIKWKYVPVKNLQADITVDFEKNSQAGYPFGLYNDSTQQAGDVNYNQTSSYDRDLLSSGINLKYLAGRMVVNFAASYQWLNDKQKIDQDFTPLSLFFVTQNRMNNNLAQELSFHSVEKSRISWVAGIFSFQQFSDKHVIVDFGKDAAMFHVADKNKKYNQPSYGTALYGQINIPFRKFNLTGGLRLDNETSRLGYDYDLILLSGDTIHTDFNHRMGFYQWLPKLALSYQPISGVNVYLSVQKGYKTGGFNSTFEREEDETYGPEYSINYETGVKTFFLQHHIEANLSLFYIDWKNQQVYQPVPSGHGAMLKNAGHSMSKGAEAEIQTIPVKNLRLYANFGYTDARFLKYEKDSLHIYNGNYIPYVPRYTLNTGINYSWTLHTSALRKIIFNLDYMHIGKIFWNVSNLAYQKNYGLLNSRVTFSTKRMDFGVWGNNLMNTKYSVFYFEELGHAFAQKGVPLQAGLFITLMFR